MERLNEKKLYKPTFIKEKIIESPFENIGNSWFLNQPIQSKDYIQNKSGFKFSEDGIEILGKAIKLKAGKKYFGDDASAGFITGIDKQDGNKVKLELGDASNYIKWDGSALTIIGTITASAGMIGGWTINATSIYTGTEDHSGYTANAGDLTIYSNGTDASIHAKNFYIDTSGNLFCTSATVSGGITTTAGSSLDGQYLTAASVASASANLALRGWTFTGAFSASDADTAAWAAGTFTASDGTAYSIGAGNTGNMAALTYIYLDIAVSTTAFQTTTTAATAIGNGKVLIAVAQNQTARATYQIFGGSGGNNLLVDNLVANSASTNEFVSNTAQLANLVVTDAKINTLAVSKLTAGTIASKDIVLGITAGTGDVTIRAGKTDFTNIDAGFILGLDDSDSDLPKFYIGDANTYLNWTGAALAVKGSITITGGSGIASLSDAGDVVTKDEADINALNLTNAPAEAGADVTGSHQAATIAGQGALAVLNVVGNAYITDLAVSKLTAGTISSQSIVLAVAAGTGDVELRAGIATGDFANAGAASGFIIGLDDSDSDKPKFYIGDASTYVKWDGTNIAIVAGTGSSIDFSYVAGATKPANNATVGATFGANITGGGSANSQVSNDGYATRFLYHLFGDGSDGDVTISANTSLTADMFYNNLTINTGYTLNPNGFRIFVKGTLTAPAGAIIARNGNVGGNGGNGTASGGAGGSAGAAAAALADGSVYGALASTVGRAGVAGITQTGNGSAGGNNGTNGLSGSGIVKSLTDNDGILGKDSGKGGDTSNPAGASGGTAASGASGGTRTGTVYNKINNALAAYLLYDTIEEDILRSAPANGGGACGGSGAAATSTGGPAVSADTGGTGGSGAGGGNGGIVIIFARTIVLGGSITANGGVGGNAGSPGASSTENNGSRNAAAGGSGGSAGGIGGNGGVIIVVYNSKTGAGTITATGGAGGSKSTGATAAVHGTGAAGAGNNGVDGTAGNDGVCITLEV